MLGDERVDDLLPGLPRLVAREHLPVQTRTDSAVEIGGAAGVDVESAAAGAAQLLLDRLDRGKVVPARHRLQ